MMKGRDPSTSCCLRNRSAQDDSNGFFVVDKPKGWTSFDVVAKLRKVLGVRKIGHAGTLDPMATGVLVIGVGKAVRLFEYMSGLEKEYEAVMEFGKVSNTDDADGKVSETGFQGEISLSDVEKALAGFRGEIEQVPPVFSAINVAGKRSYDLARKGKAVCLKSRKVSIFQLRVIRYEFPLLRVSVVCSGGTYIRALARDLGAKLGCGAILTELVRTRVGEFRLLADCHPEGGALRRPKDLSMNLSEILRCTQDDSSFIMTEALSTTAIFPMSIAVQHLPRIDLDPAEFQAIRNGRKIAIKAVFSPKKDTVFAAFYDENLVSILRSNDGGFLKPVKNL